MRWERKTKTWVLILDENFVTRCFANLNPNIFSSKIMGNIFVLWKIVYLVVIESTSTFCYHFKLDYLCWLDEKENGHQLFDFPPIPPSRPGSSPSNGFEMMIYVVWSILFWFSPGSTDQLFLATQHHRGCALPDEHSAWTTWHYMTLFFNTITIIMWLVILGTLHSIQGKRNSHNFFHRQWTRLLSSPLSSAITSFPPSSVI